MLSITQVPNLAMIASAIVFLLDIGGIPLFDVGQMQGILEAILVLVMAFAAGWNWIQTHHMTQEIAGLRGQLAAGSAAPKKKKSKK